MPSVEKRNIRRRLKRTKTRVREEGFQWTGISPFGYAYLKGGQKGHLCRIVQEEVEWVIKIFTWAAEGLARREIARRLNEAGVPTRNGGQWWASTISGIIRNPRYKGEWPEMRYHTAKARRAYQPRPLAAGTRTLHKRRLRVRTSKLLLPADQWGKTWQRPELAIVDADLWARANAMGAQNKATSARRSRELSLLKGLVYCEHDHLGRGQKAMYRYTSGKRTPVYRCRWQGSVSGPFCYHSTPPPALDEGVWRMVCDLATEPEKLLSDVIARNEEVLTRLRRLHAARAEAEALVERYEAGQANLDVMLATGEMDEERHARASALLREKQEEARRALAEIIQDSAWEQAQ